jgi:hypothetical protein
MLLSIPVESLASSSSSWGVRKQALRENDASSGLRAGQMAAYGQFGTS